MPHAYILIAICSRLTEDFRFSFDAWCRGFKGYWMGTRASKSSAYLPDTQDHPHFQPLPTEDESVGRL